VTESRARAKTKTKVLCVDDDESVARLMGEVVAFCGHEPITEMDAITAVTNHVHNPEIRAVLADYMMPKMDGLELLLVWQEQRPKVRRILITAAPHEEAVREAQRTGLVEMVIAKPPTIADIKMALAWLNASSG
jgi:DNA-binding NtrC family response regulator